MKLMVFLCISCCICVSQGESKPTNSTEKEKEDEYIINETLAKFGPLQNFKTVGLPGPEILTDRKRHQLDNQLIGDSKNYTLRIRTIAPNFSYNARYEEGTTRTTDNEETPIIKGQFAEHFKRKNGGHYIRTVGYTIDDNGFKQFLIDLTVATPDIRKRISSTALASLVGGNALG